MTPIATPKEAMTERNAAYVRYLDHQFATMSTLLCPATRHVRGGSGIGEADMVGAEATGE